MGAGETTHMLGKQGLATMAVSKKAPARNLTREVQSRAYRSPEVILTCRVYNYKIDTWGAGCIMGELMKLTPRYTLGYQLQAKENGKWIDTNLFGTGDSCYPMSPCLDMITSKKTVYSQDDQFGLIILKLDSLKEEDKDFIDGQSKENYLNYFQNFVENDMVTRTDPLRTQFRDFNPKVTDLLFSLLQFNPNKRPSCEAALKMKVFDAVRNDSLEAMF